MCGERDRGCGMQSAGVAFPMMADFAAVDEFRHDRGDHQVAAMRAVRGRSERTKIREPGRVEMKLHGLRPPVVVVTSQSVASNHGGDATLRWNCGGREDKVS